MFNYIDASLTQAEMYIHVSFASIAVGERHRISKVQKLSRSGYNRWANAETHTLTHKEYACSPVECLNTSGAMPLSASLQGQ